MTRPARDFAASARARLLDVAKRNRVDFQLTLQRYVAERFLFRLGESAFRDRFVLKGAMLFVLWDGAASRATRDLDLAGYWENDAATLSRALREICSIPSPKDGLDFGTEEPELTPIRDEAEYHGFRARLLVRLAGAVIPFQVDVGFGDAVVPAPVDAIYPVLLDGEPPRIRAYPREVCVSEKLHAMVTLAEANSRMKDFFDVFLLASRHDFTGERLRASMAATFARRGTSGMTPWPVALTEGFYVDEPRGRQWAAFLRRTGLANAPRSYPRVGEVIRAFLGPPFRAVSAEEPFAESWAPGGPWRACPEVRAVDPEEG